ncbi:hypothetical protein [Leptospira bandrabouensis]|uniref:Uncharacterized protein n=1 Tax=Leptospira bandrabouensis TaxID=2484903 RepID=A0A6H3NRR1_9LEPT|nr:hypothetical protein [Leptospira bandrabouensis]TGN09983.1 hypothetical protein EHR07_00455 [Leptospira bandrabouensis]TGN12359.1 hypothetical protein EHR08_13335 [Leptospira bandrabouensis]
MSKQILTVNLQGLFINNNPINGDTAPLGSCKEALNTVVSRQGIISSRRGFSNYSNQIIGGDISSIFLYKNKKVIHSEDRIFRDDGNGVWSEIASNIELADISYKLRSVQAKNNLYFTSSKGIKKLESLTSPVKQAGIPKALNGNAILIDTGATWLASGTNVAYRCVIGTRDVNNNLLLGSPSQRLVISNTGFNEAYVDLTFNLPDGLTTDYNVEIYRSEASVNLDVEPSDELKLAGVHNITSTDLTNGYINFQDKTIPEMLGVSLYTNQSQESLVNANDPPPFAKDMTQYKNFTLYANTKLVGRAEFNFLGVGGDGFNPSNTITIDNVTYIGSTGNISALAQFEIVTSGTPARNIEETAYNFVNVVNSYPGNTSHYAFYTSSANDIPGNVTIETRSTGADAISITSNKGTAFQPDLTTPLLTDNDTSPNKIYISKADQPEAVPPANFVTCGSKNFPIKRIIALRESVYIFKQDGIFMLSGEDFVSFRVNLLDDSTQLIAPNSAISFNNSVFAFTDQGIISVSDSGVEVVSYDIESPLIQLLSNSNINLSFGVGYESERSYILFVPETSDLTACNIAYVFNQFTNTFTKWNVGLVKAGVLDRADNRLYFAKSDNRLLRERKDYKSSDYYDQEIESTLVSYSGNELILDDILNEMKVGDSVFQGSRNALITEIDINTKTITVDKTLDGWLVDEVIKVVKPIDVKIITNPITAGNPAKIKQFIESTFLFNNPSFRKLTLSFNTNFNETFVRTDLTSSSREGWGEIPWGQNWGGNTVSTASFRTLYPANTQRGLWSSIRIESKQAFNSFELMGISVICSDISERFK